MKLLLGGRVRADGYGRRTWHRGLLGERMLGRPLFVDGLRARAFHWPPLRLARVRCERESVVVVCPPVLLTVKRGLGGCREVDRNGCASRLLRGRDPRPRQRASNAWARHDGA